MDRCARAAAHQVARAELSPRWQPAAADRRGSGTWRGRPDPGDRSRTGAAHRTAPGDRTSGDGRREGCTPDSHPPGTVRDNGVAHTSASRRPRMAPGGARGLGRLEAGGEPSLFGGFPDPGGAGPRGTTAPTDGGDAPVGGGTASRSGSRHRRLRTPHRPGRAPVPAGWVLQGAQGLLLSGTGRRVGLHHPRAPSGTAAAAGVGSVVHPDREDRVRSAAQDAAEAAPGTAGRRTSWPLPSKRPGSWRRHGPRPWTWEGGCV